MPDVIAAGAVLWRGSGSSGDGSNSGGGSNGQGDVGGSQLAVVHRPRYDDWSLPKGKLERGETPGVAAVRELAEETGCRARLGARLGEVRYPVAEGGKVVYFWSAEALGGRFEASSEVDELRWLPMKAVEKLLSYQRERDVLARFADLPASTGTVLLVRHAKAGSSRSWSGDDGSRPLSAAGHKQAEALRKMLKLFVPDRVHTAPPVRCVDTVQPLATALGLPVQPEPLLSEDGYWDSPKAGRRRLLELAAMPGVTVLCSQGGVIPDVVGFLAEHAGRAVQHDDRPGDRHGEPPARKASTWVLGLRAGQLSFADYYPTPEA